MNLAVLGAQWGDEGKGKIVDLLTPRFSIVARFQGGHNAGHTVYVNGAKFILRLIPSGILHPGVTCVIGNGVVIDPQAFFAELDELTKNGIDVRNRIVVSDKAHLILPYHRDLDLLSEARRGERKIGTTSRGIGPAYEDKIARRGIRVGDLVDPRGLEENVRDNVTARNRLVQESTMDWKAVLAQLLADAERMRPMIRDVSVMLDAATKSGQAILFEGAQGTLLDIDHGTYPYVTSSNTVAGAACTGAGIAPNQISSVVGIVKAYTTRVGSGPFPTELHDALGKKLQQDGDEFGATTGRPRRCGWFDAVVVRHAVRINGMGGLALTKLDVLTGLETIRVCTAYECNGRRLEDFPASGAVLRGVRPIYEDWPGWQEPLNGARALSDLPANARAYVRRLEEVSGAPMIMVSVGAGRTETILLRNPFHAH
jgi:adenylosuccinate synthase